MKKFFFMAAIAATALSANAQDVTYYIIGSNVNGHDWSLAQEDCKFEAKGDGIFEWNGEFLGTGFKINDGTWGGPNFGAGEVTELTIGEPFSYINDGGSGNIGFEDCTGVNNPKVVLDVENSTITVTGEKVGAYEYFFTGDFNEWALNDDNKMEEVDGILTIKNVTLPEAGEFKIASTGWAKQYGNNASDEEEPIEISPEVLTTTLGEVGGEGGACTFTLVAGEYDVTFDMDTYEITFAPAGSGVAAIAAENVEAVYYNLQGVKVANPVKGIYVKVAGKKATKVVVAE
ncbi:MAG: hypothetical protein K2H86_00105 [Muribaculaceae bacterium]|nr:hypothetical protein [Muribaculaceae bacterium]